MKSAKRNKSTHLAQIRFCDLIVYVTRGFTGETVHKNSIVHIGFNKESILQYSLPNWGILPDINIWQNSSSN